MRRRKWLLWIAAALGVLAVALLVAEATIDERLRRYLERRVNSALAGYTVSIGNLDLHLLGFAVELEDVTVVQDARPRPPVAHLPSWSTSVEWRALLSLAVVADTTFERPRLFVTRDQTAQEARDPVPVDDRGWQDALESVYPLEVNTFRIVEGAVTYFHGGEMPPVRLEHVDFRATNIRNVRSRPGHHPSPIDLRCTLLERGRLSAHGEADFLARPHPAIVADFDLRDAALAPLAPLARPAGVGVTAGTLAATGTLAVEKEQTALALERLVVSKPSLECTQPDRPRETPVERAAVAVAEADRNAGVRIDIREARVEGGTLAVKLATLPDVGGVRLDAADLPPLRLDDVHLRATNVRNAPAGSAKNLSGIELECLALESGRLSVTGQADLHAEPHPTMLAEFALRDFQLTPLAPLMRRWAVELTRGTLAVDGELAYRPGQTGLTLRRIAVANPAVEYVQRTRTDERRLEKATKATTDAEAKPPFRLDVEDARVLEGAFAFTDRTAEPPYWLTLNDASVTVQGFSNQESGRRGSASVRGRFMESGTAALDATFASGTVKPEFDLALRLEDVRLMELNDLLRARGGFDVVAGRFSFYSKLTLQNGRVDGYVKPFFEDMDVYDAAQDAGKGVGRQVYEAMVGAAGTVLENPSEDQVATRADLSGPVENPDASTFEIVVGLLRNAFWRALRPDLEETKGRR